MGSPGVGAGTALIFAFPSGDPLPSDMARAGNPSAWADDKVTELLVLWGEGLSHGFIAKKLDMPRGAVSAKCARLGLRRAKPLLDGRSFIVHQKRPPVVWPEPDAARTTLMETNGCRWPVDEVDGVHLFCDAPQQRGSSYCECHRARAYSGKAG